jgi:hypothetical protein
MKVVAAELRGGSKPSLNEALGWIGSRVDDIYGASVGLIEDVWIDPGTGAPRWLLVKEDRFGERSTLIPFNDATTGSGHLWIPYEREVVWAAPQIEPGVPLTRQVEATLSNHYATSGTAAVPHRSQPAAQADPGATTATVRLASAQPEPPARNSEQSPLPPPRLPRRPPPPVVAPRAGYAQPPPEQQQPPAPPAQVPQAGAPRYEEPRYEYQPQPAAQPPPYAYQPVYQPPPPAPPPPVGYQYQQVPQQQPPQPAAPDPSAVLAAIPPGSHVELELSGNLTISGELRQVRITPRDGGPEQRT